MEKGSKFRLRSRVNLKRVVHSIGRDLDIFIAKIARKYHWPIEGFGEWKHHILMEAKHSVNINKRKIINRACFNSTNIPLAITCDVYFNDEIGCIFCKRNKKSEDGAGKVQLVQHEQPRNFEPCSDDGETHELAPPSTGFSTAAAEGRLTYDVRVNVYQVRIHGSSVVDFDFEPGTPRPRSRDLATTSLQYPQALAPHQPISTIAREILHIWSSLTTEVVIFWVKGQDLRSHPPLSSWTST
ncbi:hypothetical protein AVEN_83956-1 [Araneus ventricosus]|uniref:Uncharacterized protein n=1 Tax=Araneus ventricosus TaxID=182803 RepID=A0A4Y2BU40_ARAVE|nr:hypothetical protein AVEN_83956-1 [Araneus ventricosus]